MTFPSRSRFGLRVTDNRERHRSLRMRRPPVRGPPIENAFREIRVKVPLP